MFALPEELPETRPVPSTCATFGASLLQVPLLTAVLVPFESVAVAVTTSEAARNTCPALECTAIEVVVGVGAGAGLLLPQLVEKRIRAASRNRPCRVVICDHLVTGVRPPTCEIPSGRRV